MPKRKTDSAEVARLKLKLAQLQEENDALLSQEDSAEISDAALPGGSKVEELVGKLSGDIGTLQIFRLESNGKRVEVGTYEVTSVEEYQSAMDSVLKVKGGGDYLAIMRDGSGKQVGQFKRSFDPSVYKPESQAAPAQAGGNFETIFAKFLEVSAAKDAAHSKELADLRLEMMRSSEKSMSLMVDIVKSQSTPMKDLLAMREFFKEPKADPIEQMLNLRDLMSELRGEAVSEAAGPLDKILIGLASVLTPKAVAAPPAPAAPALPPAARKVEPPPAPEPEKKPEPPALLSFKDDILVAIGQNMTPEAVAKLTLDSIEKHPQADMIEALITTGDWDVLYKHPDLAPHRQWVFDFRRLLIAGLTETPAEAAPEAAGA